MPLPVFAHRRQVRRPVIAMVEQVEKLHHGIDLVEAFGHRETRDFGLEGLEPWRVDGQVDGLALDLWGLADTGRRTIYPEEVGWGWSWPACRLCGDERRSRAGEGLENDLVAGADIEQGVFQQRPRFDCRMDCEALVRVRANR